MRRSATALALLFMWVAPVVADEPSPAWPTVTSSPAEAPRSAPAVAPGEPLGRSRTSEAVRPDGADASWPIAAVASIAAAFISLVGVATTVVVSVRNTDRSVAGAMMASEASIWQKANEGELHDIRDKIEGFYGPYMQLSEVNRLLADDLRARQREPDDFRLLFALFERHWLADLPPGESEVVRQVIANGERLEALIADKAGSVDASVLPYLARAGAHFRVLRLAYEGQLGHDPAQFRRYAYPRELDVVLTLELRRLQDRIDTLRDRPSARHARMAPLTGLPRLPDWPGDGPTNPKSEAAGTGVETV